MGDSERELKFGSVTSTHHVVTIDSEGESFTFTTRHKITEEPLQDPSISLRDFRADISDELKVADLRISDTEKSIKFTNVSLRVGEVCMAGVGIWATLQPETHASTDIAYGAVVTGVIAFSEVVRHSIVSGQRKELNNLRHRRGIVSSLLREASPSPKLRRTR